VLLSSEYKKTDNRGVFLTRINNKHHKTQFMKP